MSRVRSAGGHLEVERHHRLRAGQQQRMPAVHDPERRRRRRHLGHLALDGDGVARAGDEVVHRDAHLDQRRGAPAAPGRSRSVSSRSTRSVSRSSSTSASRSALPSSIASDGSMKSVPGAARLVVHDAAGPAPRVAAHRDDVAPAAHGHGGVGRRGGWRRARGAASRACRSSRWRAACTSRRAAASAGLAVSSSAAVGVDATAPAAARSPCRGAARASAAASGAVSATRRRSACTSRAATSTRWMRGELPALEHAALDPEPCERAADVGHRLGQERVAPAEERRPPRPRAPARRGSSRGRRWAGARARAPRRAGPTARAGDQLEHLAELDRLERVGASDPAGKGDGVPASVRGPAPRRRETRPRRRHQPACSSSRTIWLITLPSARPLNCGMHLAHHLADVLGAAGDRRAHRGPDLLGIHRGREELLQHRDLRLLRRRPGRSGRPAVYCSTDSRRILMPFRSTSTTSSSVAGRRSSISRFFRLARMVPSTRVRSLSCALRAAFIAARKASADA